MRLERIGENQVKLFLSTEELLERGLTQDDVINHTLKCHPLFFEILNKLYNEFDIALINTHLIDILTFNQHEIVILFTINDDDELFIDDEYDHFCHKEQLIFRFRDIEHVIQLAKRVSHLYGGGKLYSYNNEYFLIIPKFVDNDFDKITTIIMDYGDLIDLSLSFISEYGNEIIKQSAVQTINKYFLTV
jgi:adapter protein MecA 1/2